MGRKPRNRRVLEVASSSPPCTTSIDSRQVTGMAAGSGQRWWWVALGSMMLGWAVGPEAGAEPAHRPQVVVLCLQNSSNFGGRLLGRRAADQLAVDLGATGAWRVVDRAQTDRAAAQRDLQPPYAVAYMQQIGHALGGDLIVAGAVQRVEVDPRLGAVRVGLLVEMVDQVAGQAVMTVLQTGTVRRNAREPEPTDVLVGKALALASAEAVRASAVGLGFMGSVSAPSDGKTVQLKLPADAAAQTGQRLLIYRGVVEGDQRTPGKLIATAMISEITGESCRARVLGSAGDIHTGDLAVTLGRLEKRP